MTYKEAVRDFERMYVSLYINRVDYWTAQFEWSTYVDGLCKAGEITQKQYGTWATPFPEGKRLSPSKKQLERWVYEKDM